MYKRYKYRIYPTREQEELIQKTFGCCRFVYNNILELKIKKYETNNEIMGKFDCNNYCNRILKNEYEWLKEVDKYALTNSIYDMDNAYQKFLNLKYNYPKFKSKKNNKKSFKTNVSGKNIEVCFEKKMIKLPKLSWIKTVFDRRFMGRLKAVNILQEPSGLYYASLLVDEEVQKINKNDNQIGIDLGISDLAILSNGIKYPRVKFIKQFEEKLSREQRKMSKMQFGSNNYKKQKILVAKIHKHISNKRKDYLDKITKELSSKYTLICLEDLSSYDLLKNHKQSKAIIDVSWYEFNRQLQYKMDWYGGKIIYVDKWFPSSQICSCCYKRDGKKDLSIREWICPNCGTKHDRDINASINILNEGKRILGME